MELLVGATGGGGLWSVINDKVRLAPSNYNKPMDISGLGYY